MPTTDPCARWREELDCPEIVGRSPALAQVLRKVAIVAPTRRPVLLVGPTGTGKSAIAGVIHRASGRVGAMREVDCPSMSNDLFVRELFGAEQGAYTGADRRTDGLAQVAHRGTLFLEEVGDLERANQSKLLVFLETGRFRRIGGTAEHQVDVRIVAATNRPVHEDRAFRQELYHRLAGAVIVLPSLADRPEDIELLASAFATRCAKEHDRAPLRLAPDAVAALLARRWPGNLRELRQAVQGGLAEAWYDQAPEVRLHHLFPDDEPPPSRRTSHRAVMERALLARTLDEVRGNVSEAARRLGVSRSWLHTRIRRYGLSDHRASS